jgi:hypothetical protein
VLQEAIEARGGLENMKGSEAIGTLMDTLDLLESVEAQQVP